MQIEGVIDLARIDPCRFRSWPYSQDYCVTCGLCASACPVSGVDGFDPRKLVRMVGLGLHDLVESARWPWICTMCGKCEHLCPMGIDITEVVRRVRSMRAPEEVPGIIQKGLDADLKDGNNLSMPTEDFVWTMEDVGEELAAEHGFEGFKVPIDKHGANLLTTIHNKLANTHTDDLKHWWKIFHAAGEDWTLTSQNWEGTNWAFFTGNDDAMKILVGRIVEHMEHFEIKNLLWPE